jgi:hypothetical protein
MCYSKGVFNLNPTYKYDGELFLWFINGKRASDYGTQTYIDILPGTITLHTYWKLPNNFNEFFLEVHTRILDQPQNFFGKIKLKHLAFEVLHSYELEILNIEEILDNLNKINMTKKDLVRV